MDDAAFLRYDAAFLTQMRERILETAGCIAGILCLVWITGCTPLPVYHTRDGSGRPRAARSRPARHLRQAHPVSADSDLPDPRTLPTAAPRTDAHPIALDQIDTTHAYQIGVASYYGKKFQGRRTANGEVFNMYRLTAAHRVLPLGTRIRVTHLANGKWVDVKVNDRGPFIPGRILDLSFAAALEVGMVEAGTARVMIEIIDAAN